MALSRECWNADDILSRSSVNHDGRRYMSFPLPSTAPGDDYREPDTTSWRTDGDPIVDLPLKLKRIVIETHPKMVYVNDMIRRATSVVTAGEIEERCAAAGGEPGVECVDEDAAGIVRINGNSLVVPVLVIIAFATTRQRTAG